MNWSRQILILLHRVCKVVRHVEESCLPNDLLLFKDNVYMTIYMTHIWKKRFCEKKVVVIILMFYLLHTLLDKYSKYYFLHVYTVFKCDHFWVLFWRRVTFQDVTSWRYTSIPNGFIFPWNTVRFIGSLFVIYMFVLTKTLAIFLWNLF